MVTEDDAVTAHVDIDGDTATFEVANDSTGTTAVVGRARRSGG
jgi:hypothetical protein